MEIARDSRLWSWMRHWHGALVFGRRARVLAEVLAAQTPQGASVLDVGCGDGTIARTIAALRPDLSVQGLEVTARPGCKIPCQLYDGRTFPFAANSFDVCLLVDVLHHTEDPEALLKEAARVSRSFVLIKDHLKESRFDDWTLSFMDWVGNRAHGVRLTYNYKGRKEWTSHFSERGLKEASWSTRIPLYPWPFSLIVGRNLHFVALLGKSERGLARGV